jgi:hypothetical protein
MKMQYSRFLAGALTLAVVLVMGSLAITGQEPARSAAKSTSADIKNLPPRAAPTDYQTVAKVGNMTLAADFAGHGVPTSDGVFSSEDYIVVEVAFFGPPGSHVNLSYKDFSLRISGKKVPSAAQPYEGAFGSLKDPEWTPPPTEAKSKSSIGGGGGGSNDPPPAPPKMPMNLRLLMEQKVQKAAVQEGDRPLPTAGILFFSHGGKLSGIHSLELVYNGAAGKATLSLQ